MRRYLLAWVRLEGQRQLHTYSGNGLQRVVIVVELEPAFIIPPQNLQR